MNRSFRSLALAFGGLASVALAATKDVPAATPDGAAQSCIPIVQIERSEVRSDAVIDFYMRGDSKHVYRNTLPSPCPELGFERGFSYQTSLTQLCSVDIITVFHQGQPGMRGASCGLGEFQPSTLAK